MYVITSAFDLHPPTQPTTPTEEPTVHDVMYSHHIPLLDLTNGHVYCRLQQRAQKTEQGKNTSTCGRTLQPPPKKTLLQWLLSFPLPCDRCLSLANVEFLGITRAIRRQPRRIGALEHGIQPLSETGIGIILGLGIRMDFLPYSELGLTRPLLGSLLSLLIIPSACNNK